MDRLLFVDDNSSLSNFTIQAIARRFPCLEVVHAETNHYAIEQLQRLSPNLVVTDLQLPDGDGMALIEHIRRSLPETKIIVMSADTALLESVGKMHLVVGVLGKPCPIEYLLMAIEEVMQSLPADTRPGIGHPEVSTVNHAEFPAQRANDDMVRMLAEIRRDGAKLRAMLQEMLRFSCRMDESVMSLSSLVDRMNMGVHETAGGTVMNRR